jgi:Lysophospholipase
MLRILCLLSFEWLLSLSNLLIKPRMLAYDKGLKIQVKCNKFNSSIYGGWKKERFQIESDFGYVLSCELLEACKQDNTKTGDRKMAVLCHGLGCAKFESIKYAELFIKLGYTVVIYDHRNHGLSGKSFTSMGYFEKYDLKKVIDWCVLRFGNRCNFLHII